MTKHYLNVSNSAADAMSDMLQNALYGEDAVSLDATDFMLIDVAETIHDIERIDDDGEKFVILTTVRLDSTGLLSRAFTLYARAKENDEVVIIYRVRMTDDCYTVERVAD